MVSSVRNRGRSRTRRRTRRESRFAEGGEEGADRAARALIEREEIPSSVKKKAKNLIERVDKLAVRETKKIVATMNENPPEKWLWDFFEFRQRFGRMPAAAKLVKKYDARRAKQRASGKRLFAQANAQFRADKDEKARDFLREILEKAPTTFEAHYAVKWLRDE